MIVPEELPAAMDPPVTERPPFAVRLAPLPIVNVPLDEVTKPVTLPLPFQLPPVTVRVPAIVPDDLLMMPLPVNVALPFTVPVPVRVPAVPIPTVLNAAVEPSNCNVPAVMVVAPV